MSLADTAQPSVPQDRIFGDSLADGDPDLLAAVRGELARQGRQIELIASENIVSRAVLEALGSVLTNKYAGGYPKHRDYGDCDFVDRAETLSIERAKAQVDSAFTNVQPHSGAQANGAAFMTLLRPGDTVTGLSLAAGRDHARLRTGGIPPHRRDDLSGARRARRQPFRQRQSGNGSAPRGRGVVPTFSRV